MRLLARTFRKRRSHYATEPTAVYSGFLGNSCGGDRAIVAMDRRRKAPILQGRVSEDEANCLYSPALHPRREYQSSRPAPHKMFQHLPPRRQNSTSLNGPGNVFLTANVFGSGGNGTVFVAVADFNGDGKLDYVTANNGNNTTTLGIALGNGDGLSKRLPP